MFKESFKLYKRISSLEQQSDVLDFTNINDNEFVVSK